MRAYKILKPIVFILSVPLIFFMTSYQVKVFQSKSMDESEIQVLSDIILIDSIPYVYYKTTNSDLNQPLSRHLFYLKDFDLCNSVENLDSLKLSPKDRSYLVERFTEMETVNINKIIRDPKNNTLKQLTGHKWAVISLPVVFKNGKYAVYYSKGAYNGQFNLMKNIDGTWTNICSSTIWVD